MMPPLANEIDDVEEDSVWNGYPLEIRILHIVAYASVFNDGIARDHLQHVLIGPDHCAEDTIASISHLKDLGELREVDGYLFTKDLNVDVQSKKTKERHAAQLIHRGARRMRFLSNVPFVKLIAISGSVAARNPGMGNEEKTDIDIFMVTKDDHLWLVNFFLGLYRTLFWNMLKHPFCFNFIIEESNLRIPNRNLFTATEIKNMIPLYGRQTYMRFVQDNYWVKSFYPNFEAIVRENITTMPR